MHRPSRRTLLAGFVLAMTVTGTACSGPDPSSAPPPAAAQLPASSDGLRLPVEEYLPTVADMVEYDYVHDALIRACMRRFGFDYPVGSPEPTAGAEIYSVLYRRYGITTVDTARRWGYHLPEYPAVRTDQVDQREEPGWLRVLKGKEAGTGRPVTTHRELDVPQGGCLAEPERRIDTGGGSPSAVADVAMDVKSESFEASLADARVRAVFTEWARCMRTKGYEARDPLTIGDHFDLVGSATPTAAETAMAEADVYCKNQVDLVGVWFSVEAGYQIATIERRSAELSDVKAKLEHRKRSVTAIRRAEGL